MNSHVTIKNDDGIKMIFDAKNVSHLTTYGKDVHIHFFQGTAGAARYGEDCALSYSNGESAVEAAKEIRSIIADKKK